MTDQMFFTAHSAEQNLALDDALILAQALLLEAEDILPISASVQLHLHDRHDPSCRPGDIFTPEQAERVHAWQEKADRETVSAPVLLKDMLLIPLLATGNGRLSLILSDIDPAVLQKMSLEWLVDLQEKFLNRFSIIRQIYTDPETGLYNRRALTLFLATKACPATLFFIAAVPGTRTLAGGFQKINQVKTLLRTVIEEPLFYLGQSLFAAIRQIRRRSACLDCSHRLISRLKREGLRRVHIVFSSLHSKDTPQEVISRSQRLLAEAERRGPYSLCDEAFLDRKEQHPFALPPVSLLREIQKKWRGLHQFGLLLISFAQESEGDVPAMQAADLKSIFPNSCSCHQLNTKEFLLLFPDLSAKQSDVQAKQLSRKLAEHSRVPSLIGFCHWPTAGGTKTECIRSCRKAILHAGFYEKGAVVAFDSLTYNISGDLYFDEGDYKQAIKEYRAGLQLKPDDINLLNSLGVTLAEINRHYEAEACFSRVLQIEPQNYMALINKGMSCRLLGRRKEAIACFEQGLHCKEHNSQASIELYLQLGKLYCLEEKFAQALALLKEWRTRHGEPTEFIFFRLLGEAALGAGDHHEAVTALQHSLRIYPQNADSQSMLGLLYVLEDQGAEVGLSLCDRAIAADSGDARHLYRRAAALHHLGHLAEALNDVRKSLQLQRNNEQTLLLRAILYEELGSLYRAQQSFQRIVSMKKSTENRKKEALAGLARIAARIPMSSQS